ncbi:TrgA family protein [Marinovum sp.]|uniref:TrgA family protein n=1 Tax=Marinovum sp. TaxID=2024839 RepID=UPI002B269879|nr:TrgA family protein [Marinovum sp.]
MPTIPKLVAAITLSVLAFVVSKMVMDLMPEATDFGIFLPLNMAIGFFTGWFYTGPLATHKLADALSFGFTGAAIMTFVALFAQSANEMTRLAMRHRYGGPVDALVSIFDIGVDYGQQALSLEVLFTLSVGGFLAGLFAYLASLRWS